MLTVAEKPIQSPSVNENGHSNEIPAPIPKPKRTAPAAFLKYTWRPGDPRLLAASVKAREASAAKRAREERERLIGSEPLNIIGAQINETREAISRCKTADSRAKLTDTLLKLVNALAKLQAQARDQAPAPPKSGTVEPL